MIHKMKLWDDSFQATKDSWRKIENRLNDVKRSSRKQTIL